MRLHERTCLRDEYGCSGDHPVPPGKMPLHPPGQALGLCCSQSPFPHLALERTEHFGLGQESRTDHLSARARQRVTHSGCTDFGDIPFDERARIKIAWRH
jgi:hypothetical protein